MGQVVDQRVTVAALLVHLVDPDGAGHQPGQHGHHYRMVPDAYGQRAVVVFLETDDQVRQGGHEVETAGDDEPDGDERLPGTVLEADGADGHHKDRHYVGREADYPAYYWNLEQLGEGRGVTDMVSSTSVWVLG